MQRQSSRCSIALMTLLTLSTALAALAQNVNPSSPLAHAVQANSVFTLQVGPPIAGGAQSTKSTVFVVRPGGCADPARAGFTATAEGVVGGVRRTIPLKLTPLPTPGVHALTKDWPKGGVWIVNLVATCGGQTAGAIVSMGSEEKYRRESVKLLAHRATTDEIDASLRALTTGGQK